MFLHLNLFLHTSGSKEESPLQSKKILSGRIRPTFVTKWASTYSAHNASRDTDHNSRRHPVSQCQGQDFVICNDHLCPPFPFLSTLLFFDNLVPSLVSLSPRVPTLPVTPRPTLPLVPTSTLHGRFRRGSSVYDLTRTYRSSADTCPVRLWAFTFPGPHPYSTRVGSLPFQTRHFYTHSLSLPPRTPSRPRPGSRGSVILQPTSRLRPFSDVPR